MSTDFDSLLLGSATPFAKGAATYADSHPGWKDPHSRIYVKFRPKGVDQLVFLALLDTGGHYCIFNEIVAASVSDLLTESLGATILRTAHGPVRGELFLHRVELLAEEGEDLDFEAVVFVAPDWRAPSYIGYTGALERLRFAVIPESNRIYVGHSF